MHDKQWWQTGIIYQIYPRSFQDDNGDGVGDLRGILRRLDYVKSLNVNAIWLSPIFPSPMADFGYDVADYRGIDPLFGTMADFDHLLEAVHARDMKLILDLVPNHTSDQHPWFQESRSSLDNGRHDWYIWAEPAEDGGPPNNWLSFFGGPAWTLDKQTGQYYLHLFAREQPDLNWRNPAVRQAMLENMRFWLDKGVDGFRVDVIWLLMKDRYLRDEPPNPDWDGVNPHDSLLHIYSGNLPEVHDVICQMRQTLEAYDDRVLIGELYQPIDSLVTYYGQALDECHLPFNFHLIRAPWQAEVVGDLIARYEAALPDGAWPNWVLGNHDQPRLATRVGQAQARVAQMLLLTLRGTPTCYYGDEIGMENGYIPPELVQDPPAVNQPEMADVAGRDPVRTPMQWDGGPNAGFCPGNVEPWLPVAENYVTRNVAHQEEDPASMLALFRALTELRQSESALNAGRYRALPDVGQDVLAYLREPVNVDADTFLVVLNFGGEARVLDLSAVDASAQVACATDCEAYGTIELDNVRLGADKGLVLRLQSC
ncbi:MAG TPA: alpha-amylase family glycosyl hydrolase [Candidatus Sulfomarinibacteraceae bacterium]|nr:alpha-amylase family glycosyl hydrolase [Candidatus Sulfomarinibacteraceae bacterium]